MNTTNDKVSRSQLHAGHRIRLRERARKEGLSNFTEHQFLELMLSFVIARKDTNDLAHMLINKFGSLRNVLATPYNTLMNFCGLGDASATFLALLPEITVYLSEKLNEPTDKICTTNQAINYFKGIFRAVGYEKFVILLLDSAGGVLHYYTCDNKQKDTIPLDTNEISDIVSTYKAKKVIFAHNHPDGNCFPSKNDCLITQQIVMSMYLKNVDVVDHCIISPNEHFSFRSAGLINEYISQARNLFVNKFLDNN